MAAVSVAVYGYAFLRSSSPIWLGAALASSLLVLLLGQIRPHLRASLTSCFGATALVFLVMRFYPISPLLLWIKGAVQGSALGYWLIEGPGGGILGQLPGALLIVLAGRWLFGLSWADQVGAKTGLTRLSWRYGAIAGVGISIVTLLLAWLTGQGDLYWQFSWASAGVNLFSNLYEEILARGLLLQVVRKAFGDRTAMIWTGVIFGLMHGFGPKGLFIALLSWSMGWAVLRSRSLWAGWISHELSDLIVDSFLH